ncbi:11S globulin subunit beta-like [Rhodamnia argentea]|uniref:11S globulin subunit beta-like n=1 Tax=Rhodamnia argentea TaxID=178133 RepID=A0A8B8MTV6_9MYRT|nr:11S globulin subunit beta-like [Rhodamnia argentea]
MASSPSSSLLLSLGLLALLAGLHGCSAHFSRASGQGIWPLGRHPQQRQRHQLRFRTECRLDRLYPQEPSRRIEAEAGFTELWDEEDEQFACAGAAALRHVIRRNGLLLPSYTNAPKLMYVVQGNGLHGAVIPGCPETYQEDESRYQGRGQGLRGEESEQRGDRHQKVRFIREGDVIAIPAGVTHWTYNRGQSDLVLVSVLNTANEENQLDENIRKFFVAGNPQQYQQQGGRSRRWERQGRRGQRGGRQEQQEESFGNIFNGFDDDLLSDSFNVDNELARRLRGQDDQRGHIVEVQDDLQILSPRYDGGEEAEREREREREREGRRRRDRFNNPGNSTSEDDASDNGLEETLCTLRLRENIDNPERADIYNPRGGRITTLNSFSLPILSYVQLSAERGVLYRNGLVAPHYYLNSHGLIYVIRGSARLQVVGDLGQMAFDGELREGQFLVIPQNFVAIKRANEQGFEWIGFRTNDMATVSPLAGRLSVFRSLPEEVIQNAYDVSREDARRLKYNREELTVFSPGSGYRGRN